MSMTARTVNALVQLGSVICLARLLSPEDYGLVTMVLWWRAVGR
jgi:O-antigen/teichoic acid export membrane protein